MPLGKVCESLWNTTETLFYLFSSVPFGNNNQLFCFSNFHSGLISSNKNLPYTGCAKICSFLLQKKPPKVLVQVLPGTGKRYISLALETFVYIKKERLKKENTDVLEERNADVGETLFSVHYLLQNLRSKVKKHLLIQHCERLPLPHMTSLQLHLHCTQTYT